MADQLCHRYIAAHGHKPWLATPSMDKLAREGINYRRSYCSSPLCVPSRQSFYTGRNTRHHLCLCDSKILTKTTLFHHLSDSHIPSYGIGKLDFRFDNDQFHGLTERPGTDEGAQDMKYGVNNYSSFIGRTVTTTNRPEDDQCFAIMKYSLECLRRDESSLILTSFLKPHESSDNELGYDAPHHFFELYNCVPHLAKNGREWGYCANVSCFDHYLGLCLKQAESENLLDENVLIIFCGDHGEMAGSYGRWGKLCFFEDAIRVPLMLWHKGIQSATHFSPRALIDVFPTVFEWFGLPSPECDGYSLLKPRPFNSHVFIEYFNGYFHNRYHNWYQHPLTRSQCLEHVHSAIIQDQWKFLYHKKGLYLHHIKKGDGINLWGYRPQIQNHFLKLMEKYPIEDIFQENEYLPDSIP